MLEKLEWPLIISSRLLPAVRVGESVVSVERTSEEEWVAWIDARVEKRAGVWLTQEICVSGFRGPSSYGSRLRVECVLDFMLHSPESFEGRALRWVRENAEALEAVCADFQWEGEA